MGDNRLYSLICCCYDAFMSEFFSEETKEVEYPLKSINKWDAREEALALMKALKFGDVNPKTLEKQTNPFTKLQAKKDVFMDFGFFRPMLKIGNEVVPLA